MLLIKILFNKRSNAENSSMDVGFISLPMPRNKNFRIVFCVGQRETINRHWSEIRSTDKNQQNLQLLLNHCPQHALLKSDSPCLTADTRKKTPIAHPWAIFYLRTAERKIEWTLSANSSPQELYATSFIAEHYHQCQRIGAQFWSEGEVWNWGPPSGAFIENVQN